MNIKIKIIRINQNIMTRRQCSQFKPVNRDCGWMTTNVNVESFQLTLPNTVRPVVSQVAKGRTLNILSDDDKVR